MLTCPYCKATESFRIGFNEKGLQRYKCKSCGRKFTAETPENFRKARVHHPCAICGQLTINPRFCSLSCSATNSNLVSPKRKKHTRCCKRCGKQINATKRRSRYCFYCNRNIVDRSTQTIGEIQYSAKYQVSALIRHIARLEYKRAGYPYICQNCGYDKHVEICHIQAIEDFPPEAIVSVVSGIDNLIALCPNCHWEFDHGLLVIDTILQKTRTSETA